MTLRFSAGIVDDGNCDQCDQQLDSDCFGGLRCLECDPPCPGCVSGGLIDLG